MIHSTALSRRPGKEAHDRHAAPQGWQGVEGEQPLSTRIPSRANPRRMSISAIRSDGRTGPSSAADGVAGAISKVVVIRDLRCDVWGTCPFQEGNAKRPR